MLSESSKSSYNEDEDDDRTGAKYINGNSKGNGDSVGDRNTGTGGTSAEWIRFLSPRVQTKALGTMAKTKSSSSIASRKTQRW